MGPEPLSGEFNAQVLARACQGRKASLKATLLDQHVVGGLGNIYASEALYHARVSPLALAASLSTTAGRPTAKTPRVVASIKAVLTSAIRRAESPYREGRFRVYEREGLACLRKGCRGTIKRITQTGRSTFFCPVCQR
jgi:formamidopyrimidine-DNA glycosylase